MTRLEKVIEEVKNARYGKNRPWIYDENGKIKDEVICGEVLDLLEEMKDYEIEVDDDFIGELLEADYVSCDNTYNYGANISNDIDFHIVKDEIDGYYFVAMVHLFGDVRGNYSDYFVLHFDKMDEWFEFESLYQTKCIDENLVVTIHLLSDVYEVYDYEKDEEVGYFYECEVEDLLKEIEERG